MFKVWCSLHFSKTIHHIAFRFGMGVYKTCIYLYYSMSSHWFMVFFRNYCSIYLCSCLAVKTCIQVLCLIFDVHLISIKLFIILLLYLAWTWYGPPIYKIYIYLYSMQSHQFIYIQHTYIYTCSLHTYIHPAHRHTNTQYTYILFIFFSLIQWDSAVKRMAWSELTEEEVRRAVVQCRGEADRYIHLTYIRQFI